MDVGLTEHLREYKWPRNIMDKSRGLKWITLTCGDGMISAERTKHLKRKKGLALTGSCRKLEISFGFCWIATLMPSSFAELKPSIHSCFFQKHFYIFSLVFNTSLYSLYYFFLNLFPLFLLSSFISRELMQQFLFHVLKWPLYIREEFM